MTDPTRSELSPFRLLPPRVGKRRCASPLKAAAIDPAQLADRARRNGPAGTADPGSNSTPSAPATWMIRDGRRRAEAAVRTLAAAHPLTQLVVHVPYQGVADVTVRDFDADQVRRTIDFAGAVGAEAVVVHRYWGLVFGDAPPRTTREEAVAGFALAKFATSRSTPARPGSGSGSRISATIRCCRATGGTTSPVRSTTSFRG